MGPQRIKMRRIDLIGVLGVLLLLAGLVFFDPFVRESGMFVKWMLGPLLRLVGGVLFLGWAMYRLLNPGRSRAAVESTGKQASSNTRRAA
jgi:ATP/ADP translocase